ncbi:MULTISPECIES: dTDP-4-dehydrorhamnose reductase [unclassified Caballeronia]|uniref:dTDP-4-dehydrorhamnose reductase n=1 Tax=unclassified Caballeronia TaxID=2646786 RepID=UPI00158ADBB9|nr:MULTISPECIES: dTDP-4-dehydrorhamnose reductase [unclassified Caballeronia]QSN60697.1 dTDP-4-dehydrorhamnose reductase [Caballeronia sp. M1242]
MRLLLTGANGQVGWELARSLLPLGEVVLATRQTADFTKPNGVAGLVESVRPDVIVNAAAYTAVDNAEQEEEVARRINGDAVAEIAAAAARTGALLVHYSTDYVFDGTAKDSAKETDAAAPLNAYGRSKLAGEEAIIASQCDYLIFRTTWVYAARGKNFLLTMLKLAAQREELKVVADQTGAPTSARLIADLTAHCIRHAHAERLDGRFESGRFHMTAGGSVSWHGFAEALIDYARAVGRFDIKTRTILPIATSEYPLPARRPANSRLDCSHFDRRFGLHRPAWDVCMRQTIDQLAGV